MMIESIEFKHFKALRDTTLPLGQFTLIVGPNGSGKSTVFQALLNLHFHNATQFARFASAGIENAEVAADVTWVSPIRGAVTQRRWRPAQGIYQHRPAESSGKMNATESDRLHQLLAQTRVYSFDANAVASPVSLRPHMELQHNGQVLAGVLDRLRDQQPERFEALNLALAQWIPEFDRVLFDTPSEGQRAIALRTREGSHKIPAAELWQGTLLALAILTLAYLPDPPPLVGFEEPDRGLHPRLLTDVRDALYRLAYPDRFGEKREPVQVIATTHNPYLLRLFRDHPEEIVIAEKVGQEAWFEPLVQRPEIDEILRDGDLGEIWYSGVLGGVPAGLDEGFDVLRRPEEAGGHRKQVFPQLGGHV